MRILKAAAGALCAVTLAGGLALAQDAVPSPAAAPSAPAAQAPAEVSEAPKPTWDQAANIRSAAEHLGKLQIQRGAKGAYDFISACYKTQSLAEAYGAPFEACIAQDYMQTQVLALVYSRMSPEQLQKMRAPSAQDLADSMGKRIVSAFGQYKIPVSYAGDFKKLVDDHGFPVFLKIVFPNAKVPTTVLPGGTDGVPLQETAPAPKP